MPWKDEESEVALRLLLSTEYAFYATNFYLLALSTWTHGLLIWASLGYIVAMCAARVLFQRIADIHSGTWKQRVVFLTHQLIQTLIVGSYLNGDESSLVSTMMISTVVMTTMEVSPVHPAAVNVFLIAKHMLVWICVGRRSIPGEQVCVMPLMWVFYCVTVVQMWRKDMIARKRQVENERIIEEKRLICLLHAIPDGIVVISQGNEIISFNPALLLQFGLEQRTDPIAALSAVIPTLQYDSDYLSPSVEGTRLMHDLSKFMKQSVGAVCNFKPVIYQGKYLECRGCVSQWGETKVVVLTVRDTSNWVSLEKTAKQDSANKTALLRSVSHELRTPVNAIINLVQDIHMSQNLSEQEQADVEVMLSASSFLMSMINDLLDYSRILHDKFALTKSSFELESVIRASGHLIESQCRQKNIRFSVRFTLKGSVTLVANLSGRDHLKISVEDTGIGIPEQCIPHIFTMFGKVEGDQSINPQGCGLGLSISSMLVSKLGGSGIKVVSVPKQGSTFSFSIPLSNTSSRPSSLTISPEELDDIPSEVTLGSDVSPYGKSHTKNKAEILIVDDSPFNRLVLRKILEAAGYTFAEASTGLEALRLITAANDRGSPFSVIIMDIEMPEMDGIAATREVKMLADRGAISQLPVIIGCSAFSTEEDKAVALSAGMNYYIEKPVARQRLIQLVASHVVMIDA